MGNILWLKDTGKRDVLRVGIKASSLGEMFNADIPVPDGFCVTAEAYREFLEETNLDVDIYVALDKVDFNDNASLHDLSEKIQERIMAVEFPAKLRNDILKAYDNMNVDIDVFKAANKKALDIIKAGRDLPFVAVRSSTLAEEDLKNSFARQQATFLNVRGKDHLIDSIRRCWVSLFSVDAIMYRVDNNLDHQKVYLPIIIQKMVRSDKSGVISTVHPETKANEVFIEAGLGLGEAIVTGAVNPDSYIVDKESFEIKERVRGKQDYKIVLDINLKRNVKKLLDPTSAEMQKLSDGEIVRLARLSKLIETYYDGTPQDIEFAIEGSRFFVIQARPLEIEEEKDEIEEIEQEVSEEPQEQVNEEDQKFKLLDTITEVKVIVDGSEQAVRAAGTGADGVGAFKCNLDSSIIHEDRKEELIHSLTSEIRNVAKEFDGKPVWYKAFDSLMPTQFEAIKRLHDEGFTNVGVMIPSVIDVDQIREAKENLRAIGLEPLEEIDFGIVVETPAAVLLIKDLCKEGLDFVSIGTDELIKHTLAGGSKEMHPAILESVKRVVRECKEHNVETSLGGSAANNLDMAEWAVKIGVDSMAPSVDAHSEVRRIVSRTEKRLLLGAARQRLDE